MTNLTVRMSPILRSPPSKSKGSGASASTTHRRRQPIHRLQSQGMERRSASVPARARRLERHDTGREPQ
jgi:hypothetical protein